MDAAMFAVLQDVADSLQQHAADVAELQPDFQPHQLLPTASSLLRVLKVGNQLASGPAAKNCFTTAALAHMCLAGHLQSLRLQVLGHARVAGRSAG
jgi:hypothetical protein